MDSHALCDFCVIDSRIVQCSADVGFSDAAIMAQRHPLNMHDFLVVSAVIMHDTEERNRMVRGGPEHTGCVHQIAVILNRNAQATILFVRQCCSHSSGSTVAHACSAGTAQELIRLLEIP